MRFLPPGTDLDGTPHVLVGGRPRTASVLSLSNVPGSVTPTELRADTAAEMALRLLRSPERERRLAGVEAVSAERCDADGLLGVWALLEPDAALRRADQVADAARAGTFSVRRSAEAAQFAC